MKRTSVSAYSFLLILLALSGCMQAKRPEAALPDPPHYRFSKPDKKMVLNEGLDEISGICFYPNDTLLAAIQDEDGYLFALDTAGCDIQTETYFGADGDFEDLAFAAGHFYVLKSNGDLLKIIPDGDKSDNERFTFEPDGDYEFESLYLHQDSLMLVTKESGKKQKGIISVFGFAIKSQKFATQPSFTIKVARIHALLKEQGDAKKNFRPSAAAVHPVEKQLYLISATDRLLVITTLQGKVLNAYPLNPGIFKQPEGLAFNQSGDLFISNEAKGFNPNMYRFNYTR